MDGDRGSNALVIAGTNDTGKSVLSLIIVEQFDKKRDRLKKNGRKYPSNYHKLVTFDPQDRYAKYRREGDINIIIGDEGWEDRILALRDSLCIFDDFRMLMGEDKTSKKLLQIFGWRAEYGLDLVFICWHPLLIPPRISMFMDKYWLLRTNGTEKDFVARINGNKDKIAECRRLLDKEFLQYNDTQYKALYPNFPFIYYDTGTDKALKINFKK